MKLSEGAYVDTGDEDGKTAMMLAAERGFLDVVKLLLEKGAHIDSRDAQGNTALMKAIGGAHNEVGKLLLESGADVELKNVSGESSLSLACKENRVSILTLMLQTEVLHNRGNKKQYSTELMGNSLTRPDSASVSHAADFLGGLPAVQIERDPIDKIAEDVSGSAVDETPQRWGPFWTSSGDSRQSGHEQAIG